MLWLVALVLLTLVSLLALVGGSAVLQDAMETVSRDVRSAALANEIEASVLMHQRLSNLYVVTGDAAIDLARDAIVTEIQSTLQDAHALVGVDAELHLLNRVQENFDRYMRVREQAEAPGRELAEVVRQARGSLAGVLDDLRALRELNDAQVLRARAETLRVDRLATWTGASAAILMIAGFLAIAWGVRRYLLKPVLALHDAMARFRAGDADARSGTAGVREVEELAGMFDEMAESLAEQRRAQLTYLAGVAHDLKSPMSTLKTGMYTLEHEPSELRRGKTRAILDRQVDLLTRMVDDLLDATRIEAGQLELRQSRFDLRRLVNDVVRLYVPTAPSHRIVARVPEAPVMIEADTLRVEQVVRNLVSNAVKYSPEGGPVDVSVESREDGDVVLSVSDAGMGISQEDLPDIFLPFRRRKLGAAPGAGLGLSVVRRIVSAHGGRIDVDSEPGVGSTFRITLPRRVPPEVSLARPRVPAR